MTPPERLVTERFALPLVTEAEVAAAGAGRRAPTWHDDYPSPDDLDAFTLVRDGSTWGPRHIVRTFDGLVVGSVGFLGDPVDDEVEVGFGLVEYARGHGVATECLRALLAHTALSVRAATRPENARALRVLAKTGFTRLRGSDEDGRLVMVRPAVQEAQPVSTDR